MGINALPVPPFRLLERTFAEVVPFGSSVPVLTFVSCRGGYFYECQNQRDTSNHMILVWL
jgi:hypothetical protein